MRHFHWWVILGCTALVTLQSANSILLRRDAPLCNFAVVIPFGLLALFALEAGAYAAWAALRFVRRRLRPSGNPSS